jgi:hypothetical protein
MSEIYDPQKDSTNVTARVNRDFLEEFDRALKKAQIEGEVSMNLTRAEALRRLMEKGISDPSLFAETDQK